MSPIRNALWAASLFLLGCGATGSLAVTYIPEDYWGPGSYTVPAVPSVSFPISTVHVEQEDGTFSIYYKLPATLVGQPTSVSLTGAPDATGTIQLSGTAGTSTCTVTSGVLSCQEHLSGVVVSEPPAEATDAERAAAQAFSDDPIGVLAVQLPP